MIREDKRPILIGGCGDRQPPMTCGRRGESGSVRQMEKIAGQARNARPAEGSVPAEGSAPAVRSSRSPPERSLRPDGHCGLDPQSFPSPERSQTRPAVRRSLEAAGRRNLQLVSVAYPRESYDLRHYPSGIGSTDSRHHQYFFHRVAVFFLPQGAQRLRVLQNSRNLANRIVAFFLQIQSS
jgi:hypothetical protein